MSNKTYINGLFIKSKQTTFGEVVSVSINAKTLIEELNKLVREFFGRDDISFKFDVL